MKKRTKTYTNYTTKTFPSQSTTTKNTISMFKKATSKKTLNNLKVFTLSTINDPIFIYIFNSKPPNTYISITRPNINIYPYIYNNYSPFIHNLGNTGFYLLKNPPTAVGISSVYNIVIFNAATYSSPLATASLC